MGPHTEMLEEREEYSDLWLGGTLVLFDDAGSDRRYLSDTVAGIVAMVASSRRWRSSTTTTAAATRA